jgi:succinate-acetate transporter protein
MRVYTLSIVILAMGFALGGAAQIIAGIMEFKKIIPLVQLLFQRMVSFGGL